MNEIRQGETAPAVPDRSPRSTRDETVEPAPPVLTLSPQRQQSLAGRRIRLLYALLLAVASAAGGAWLAGSRIESPADLAARTAPPPPSLILVPVEQRVLSADVITRGTVRFGLPQPVSLAPSPLKTGASLVTTLPLRNTQINEGNVLLTASGRPVFVLQGRSPAYRDLGPGLAGADVSQLKQALRRLGFDPGGTDEAYDDRTAAAVAAWYHAKGWEPFGPTREQRASIRGLEREWSDAVKAKAAAAAALSTTSVAVQAARASAAQNVKASAVEAASRQPAQVPAAQGGSALALENERAKAQSALSAADADLLAQINEQALVALDPRNTEMARKAAEAKLAAIRAARKKALLEGELAVQAAEREAALAKQRADVARAAVQAARLEGERAVRAALDAQNLAALELKIASGRETQAAADLAAANRRIGVQVPVDEVVFVPALPVRVEQVNATIGGSAAGTLLTITDNQLAVDSSLPLDAAPLVKPGMKVAIDEQALGLKATGIVEMVATTPGIRGVDAFHIYLGVRVNPTPVRLEGFSVRLTIPIRTTNRAVTAVPVSALSLAPSGMSRVLVRKNGTFEYVTVTPGLSANGYVEVTPVDGTLQPSEMVVVGYNNPDKDTK